MNDKNDTTGGSTGTTWIYAYDRGGNILSKTAYAFTAEEVGTAVRTYLYGYTDSNWKDKLTSFDNSTITYDAIGNPLSDGTWTYVWQAGRQLRSMTKADGNDTITVEFEYDHAGLRTKKTKKVNNVITEVTEYILNGKNVVELIHTAYPENSDPVVNVLHFYYDAQGRAAMVKYNGVMYGYVYDLQGDVIGILDSTGSAAVEYKYDAWGKPLGVTGTLAASLGEINPFRYRGYVFDDETQLYYLRSRYYDASASRFKNADKTVGISNDILSHTVYCYCRNNPIAKCDPDGFFDWKSIDISMYYWGKLIASILTDDEFGYTILERWFNGLGAPLIIKDDSKWNQFMLNNDAFRQKIRLRAESAVYSGSYTFEIKNESLVLGYHLHEHDQGDYSTGYGLINGSNSKYGGFCVNGKIEHINGNKYKITAKYEFNDYIDPGPYPKDWILAIGARFLLGPCVNYVLQISGTVEFDFYCG